MEVRKIGIELGSAHWVEWEMENEISTIHSSSTMQTSNGNGVKDLIIKKTHEIAGEMKRNRIFCYSFYSTKEEIC